MTEQNKYSPFESYVSESTGNHRGADVQSERDNNRRTRFRLRLPKESRLVATINGLPYDVIEVAEHSLVVASNYVVNKNGFCSGLIVWGCGEASPFTGEQGRLGEMGRVIWNVEGITTLRIIKEQRRLMKLFPKLESEDLKIEIFNPED